MPYSQLASMRSSPPRVGLEEEPATEGCGAFVGRSVGRWPAFPDTVDALWRLGRPYQLVVLSNVDRESFEATDAGAARRGRVWTGSLRRRKSGRIRLTAGILGTCLRRLGRGWGWRRVRWCRRRGVSSMISIRRGRWV